MCVAKPCPGVRAVLQVCAVAPASLSAMLGGSGGAPTSAGRAGGQLAPHHVSLQAGGLGCGAAPAPRGVPAEQLLWARVPSPVSLGPSHRRLPPSPEEQRPRRPALDPGLRSHAVHPSQRLAARLRGQQVSAGHVKSLPEGRHQADATFPQVFCPAWGAAYPPQLRPDLGDQRRTAPTHWS